MEAVFFVSALSSDHFLSELGRLNSIKIEEQILLNRYDQSTVILLRIAEEREQFDVNYVDTLLSFYQLSNHIEPNRFQALKFIKRVMEENPFAHFFVEDYLFERERWFFEGLGSIRFTVLRTGYLESTLISYVYDGKLCHDKINNVSSSSNPLQIRDWNFKSDILLVVEANFYPFFYALKKVIEQGKSEKPIDVLCLGSFADLDEISKLVADSDKVEVSFAGSDREICKLLEGYEGPKKILFQQHSELKSLALKYKFDCIFVNDLSDHDSQIATVKFNYANFENLFESSREVVDEFSNGRLVENPLISVVLCTFNRSEFLIRALKSLEEQTFRNFEVVIVDDGSSNMSYQSNSKAAQDSSLSIRYIYQKNSYLGSARNAGAKAARGQILLFMDDDNLADVREVELVSAHSRQLTEGNSILCSDAYVFEEEGVDSLELLNRKMNLDIWSIMPQNTSSLIEFNLSGDANFAIGKSQFFNLGGFTQDSNIGHEDWEFFLHAKMNGYSFLITPEPTYFYYINRQGMLRGRKPLNLRHLRPEVKRLISMGSINEALGLIKNRIG